MADIITLIVGSVALYVVDRIVRIVAPYLVDLFNAVAPQLLDPIVRELDYLFHYHSNIEKLNEEVNKLQKVSEPIKAAWTNADEIEPDVEEWLTSVDRIIENALKFLEDEKKDNKWCFNGLCCNLKSWNQKSKKAKQTAAEIATKIQKRYQLSSSPPPRKIRITPIEGYEAFESRKPTSKKIMEALRNADVNLIGVYGMGGTGKTVLVKEIARKCEENKLFDEVIMTVVSQPPSVRKIQGEIADKLNLTLKEETESGRAGRLCEKLKELLMEKKKSILVILDDIWEKLDLAEVGIPFGGNHSGCKIVMTSRNRHVLSNVMGTQEVFGIEVLFEEEAWDLFKKIAGDSIEHRDLRPTAIEVVKECGGLPIAIVTVASALKNNKNLHIWKDALRQLTMCTPTNIGEMHPKVYRSLKLSYDFQSKEAKLLFLLCSLFPEDYQFSITDILKYGKGLGLFQEINALEEARDVVHTLVYKLKDSSLLLDNNPTGFRMHDVVRDVGIYVASEDEHMLIVKNDIDPEEQRTEEKLRNCRAISLPLSNIQELPEGLKCPKLNFFLLFTNDPSLKIPETFFKGMEQLKVLSLRNMCFSSLPSSLRFLSNLRTLCLDDCVFQDIPRHDLARIGELKKLEVLSFASSDIAELPGEIRQLTCLRLLDLRNCSKLKVILPNIIAKLTRLEDLYMEKSFDRWEVDGNASLAELKHLSRLVTLDIHIPDTNILPKDLRFENLMRYRISIGDGWRWYGDYETSRTLKLKFNTSIQEFGLNKLLERTEDLYLDEMNGIKNGLCSLNRDGFPHLRHLHVQKSCEMEYVVNTLELFNKDKAFPELRSLFLHNLINLKKICHGQLPTESFSNLGIVEVESCNSLKNLFSLSMVKSLRQLRTLKIEDCEIMDEIVSEGIEASVGNNEAMGKITFPQLHSLELQALPKLSSFYSKKQTSRPFNNYAPTTDAGSGEIISEAEHDIPTPLFNEKVSFPNLEVLSIWNVNSLKEIWPSQLPIDDGSFCNLKSFYVGSCKHLLNIIPSNMLMGLQNMESLSVSGCGGSLECIFDLGGLNDKEMHVELRDLKIWNLSGLKQIWKKDPQTNFLCQKLSSLEVSECGNLRSIFTTSMVKSLEQLRDLSISECKMVEEIVEEEGVQEQATDKTVFPQLTSLALKDLPELKSFCQGSHILEWPSSSGGDNVEIFALESSSFEEMRGKDHIGTPTEQPLFLVDKVAFPNLEVLSITKVDSLKEIWPSQLPVKDDSFCNLKSLYIESCEHLLNIIPSNMLMRLRNLESLKVAGGNRLVEYIFDVGELNDMERHVLRSIPLRELSLQDCPRLKQIWKTDSQLSAYFPFQNLTSLEVISCSDLRHIFTTSIAKSLVQLQQLDIRSCEMVDEIVGNEGVEEESMGKIEFPRLTSLTLGNLPQLKSFYQGILKVETFSLESSSVEESHGKGHVGTPTKPLFLLDKRMRSIVQVAFPNLEELSFRYVNSLKEIWPSQLPVDDHSFCKLKTFNVNSCGHLLNIIPSNMLMRLRNLESLEVAWCNDLVEYIFDVGELNDMERHVLRSIPLRKLSLNDCPRLKQIWKTDSQLSAYFSFQNLTSLEVCWCQNLRHIFTTSIAKSLVQLQQLSIVSCEMVEEIVGNEGVEEESMGKIVFPGLTSVTLDGLPQLKSFYQGILKVETFSLESSSVEESHGKGHVGTPTKALFLVDKVVFPNLEELKLRSMSSMKEIWQDQYHAASFGKLRVLQVCDCESLTHVLTFTIAKSLVQIESIIVDDCKMMKEVIASEERKETDETTFSQLNSLELRNLPNLTSFSSRSTTFSFPSLEQVLVEKCPELKTFSNGILHTPKLHKVLVQSDKESDKGFWKGGLNSTIQYLFKQKVEFLRLSELSELKQICYDQFPVEACYVQYLVVKKCTSLLNVVSSIILEGLQKLKKITVESCDSLEQVFDLERLDCGEERYGLLPNLKEMNLTELPKLRCLWNKDPKGILSFQSLSWLNIHKCNSLRNLFSPSMLPDLHPLDGLKITDCLNMKEIVEKEKEAKEEAIDEIKFDLLYIILQGLPNLTSFYPGNHTLVFPYLETMKIAGCPRIKTFTSTNEGLQESFGDGNVDVPSAALFINNKVEFHELDELELEDLYSIKELWQGQLHAESFCKLTTLTVRSCQSLTHLLPFEIAKSLVQIKSIIVDSCEMMKEIIASEEGEGEGEEANHETTFSQLSSLKLRSLPNLTNFCIGSNTLSFPSLEQVLVEECPKLKTFSNGILNTTKLEKVQVQEDEWVWKDNLNTTIQHLFA